ncbi:TRAP transporter substrate-binding protein [Amphritea sp.]|uniref:TRAP transporter substrate-binding protein n=1 Tax=Amphritea sp. TaxID=1872502 RepID=UPI003A8EEFD1
MKAVASAILGTSLILTCGIQSAQAGSKLLLKTPTAFPSSLPVIGTTPTTFSETLKTISGGDIKVKLYDPGKLVSPTEILDAVSNGKVNSGFAAAGYWQGKLPAAPLFSSVPFGPEAGEYLAWMYQGNGMKLYQRMYDEGGFNVKALVCGVLPPETSGWFAKPINKPEDLKGMNMRFYGLGADVMSKLGVGVVKLPGGEIFGALEKGAVDAAEFSLPVIDQKLGFHKVVKYNYFPGWHQQSTLLELLINKDTWTSLSEQQQALIETACKSAITDSLAEGEASQFKPMQEAQQNGAELRYWNDTMLNTFKTAWHEVASEQSAANPFFKEVWQDMSAFRTNYKLWKSNGYLPTDKPEAL